MRTFYLIVNIISLIAALITVSGLVFIILSLVENKKKRKLINWVDNLQMFVPLMVGANLENKHYDELFNSKKNADILSTKYFDLYKIIKINKIWGKRFTELKTFCEKLNIDWKKWRENASEFEGPFRHQLLISRECDGDTYPICGFDLDNIVVSEDRGYFVFKEAFRNGASIYRGDDYIGRTICVYFFDKIAKIGAVKYSAKIIKFNNQKYETYKFKKIKFPNHNEIISFNKKHGFQAYIPKMFSKSEWKKFNSELLKFLCSINANIKK